MAANTHMQYRVIGADKRTGKDLEFIFEASNEEEASLKANARGMLVASCSRLSPAKGGGGTAHSPGAATTSIVSPMVGAMPLISRTALVIAGGVALGLVILGVVTFMMLRGSSGTASPQSELSPALVQFRTALFKMRADLKLGLSDKEYLDNLRSLQLASDQATALVTATERETPVYKTLQKAFDEYMVAYQCIKKLEHPDQLPEYPGDIDRMQADGDAVQGVADADLTRKLIDKLNAAKAKKARFDAAIAALESQKQQCWATADQLLSPVN